ncbi:hypothetical protein L2E82_17795 [Cichorium intybus]|uniref:Uncharacterized protein n=1 Tax=Cichorium intybus TaxID=13427 RepID=A0ACB9F960_CICIN|nr:hypothetical protein L2E82_17795 [Cichorium intybus]
MENDEDMGEEEEKEVMGEEEDEDVSEESERPSESEIESSENFSDEEDEESVGESFVKDSSPEEHVENQMIRLNANFDTGEGEKENRATNILEKSDEKKREDNSEINNMKEDGASDPIERMSPIEENQKEEAQAQRSNSKKDTERDWAKDLKDKTQEDLDTLKEDGLPISLNGVSDRLKELLSTSTPLKEKIKRKSEEIVDSNLDLFEGAILENIICQDKVHELVKTTKKKTESKQDLERRMTRSQSRLARSKERREDSDSSVEFSSNYIQGAEDKEQKLLEVGAKCGIRKEKEKGRGQRWSTKKGEKTGNQ